MLEATAIPGCYKVCGQRHDDSRGSLVKTFVAPELASDGAVTVFTEHFHSWSRSGVLRGLHFQTPPAASAKLVTCMFGRVADAVVDLRRGSPTEGQHLLVELDGDAGDGIYVPSGLAHGFCVLGESALVAYATERLFDQACDAGVLWSSAGIDWPLADPMVSERDASLPPVAEYASPFMYTPRTQAQ